MEETNSTEPKSKGGLKKIPAQHTLVCVHMHTDAHVITDAHTHMHTGTRAQKHALACPHTTS